MRYVKHNKESSPSAPQVFFAKQSHQLTQYQSLTFSMSTKLDLLSERLFDIARDRRGQTLDLGREHFKVIPGNGLDL